MILPAYFEDRVRDMEHRMDSMQRFLDSHARQINEPRKREEPIYCAACGLELQTWLAVNGVRVAGMCPCTYCYHDVHDSACGTTCDDREGSRCTPSA